MARVCGILLAAGESRRMGGVNKLTLPIEGVPMVRRMVQMLLLTELKDIVVVLGHEVDTIAALIDDLPVDIVINEHYAQGQMTTVHCGLAALGEGVKSTRQPCDGVMVCLSDQPLLNVDDVNSMIAVFSENRPEGVARSVLVPTWKGQRGNPIILSSAHQEAILAGDRNLGCKNFISNNPDLVTTMEMPNDHVVVDLDTAAAYQAYSHEHEKVS